MKWTDTFDIAIALYDRFPDIDPMTIRFWMPSAAQPPIS